MDVFLVASHFLFCCLCVLLHLLKPCSSVAQVRLRCQKGIPPALRGRAWLYLSGGKVKKEQNQGKFQVRQLSLSVSPHSVLCCILGTFFFYISFPCHKCNYFGQEPYCILHRTRASSGLFQLV